MIRTTLIVFSTLLVLSICVTPALAQGFSVGVGVGGSSGYGGLYYGTGPYYSPYYGGYYGRGYYSPGYYGRGYGPGYYGRGYYGGGYRTPYGAAPGTRCYYVSVPNTYVGVHGTYIAPGYHLELRCY